jgi:myo-inositol 2-dehydrogenase / D-chiro-inositol 1-dehydrogenase
MNIARRTFLLASAAAARSGFSQGNDPILTALIGTGSRGSNLLQGVLQQSNAKVAALCDIKPDRLDTAASRAVRDKPDTYTDWRRIVDRKDVGAVFVATPPHLHAEMAVAALKSGKHVYCEKPIGVTAAQVKTVLEAARASKRVFVAGQQLRSQRLLVEAVRKIHEGVIGEILMVKAQRHGNADLPHDSTSADWYFDVTKSGGYLIEMSVHNLDLCNWVIGGHPLRAMGLGGIALYKDQPAGRTIYDNGSLTFEYAKGVKMSFTQNVFHPRGLPGGGQYVYVYGSKGAVDLMAGPAMMYPLGQVAAPVALAEKQQDNPHAHIVAFYACVTSGGANPADINVGATAALTSILGHEAMTKQAIVRWEDLGVKV